MARDGGGSRDAAVSSVVGTVLMLAITMAVFAGFSLVVIDRVTADDPVGARAQLDVEEQGGRLLLLHRGGEPLTLSEGELTLVLEDGTAVQRPLDAVADQVADGATWHIGESLCLAGPQPPCLYSEGEVTDLRLVYAGELAFDGLAPGTVTIPVVTYVATATAASGSVVALANAQSATDSAAEAVLQEAGTANPAGTAGPTTFSGTPSTLGGAQSPANAASSDDQSATMDTAGDTLDVSGFTLPGNIDAITAVSIGYEGRKDSTGGTSPTTRLDHSLDGVSFTTGTSVTESATADTARTGTLCSTPAECATALLDDEAIEGMTVRVTLVDTTNREAVIDHIFLTVTYTTLASTTYDLEVQLDFEDVPSAGTRLLELRYRTAGDTFRVEVWDGDSYVPRGTLDSASVIDWTYELATTAEFNSGAPRIRIVDLTPDGTTQGSLFLDFVRVVGT